MKTKDVDIFYTVKVFYERTPITQSETSNKIDWFAWSSNSLPIEPKIEDVKSFIRNFIPCATGEKISIKLEQHTHPYPTQP